MPSANSENLPARAGNPTAAPAPMAPQLDREVRFLASRMTAIGLGFQILAQDAPTPDARRDLAIRASSLDHWLRPAGKLTAGEIGSIMLMKARSEDAFDIKRMILLFEHDVADLPLFALSKACADFRQGRAGDGWRPTPFDVRKQAQTYVEPWRAERIKIGQVLEAKVVTVITDPEKRKRMADLLRQTARGIEVNGKVADARYRGTTYDPKAEAAKVETPQDSLARLAREIQADGLSLSPALRRKVQAAQGIDPEKWEDEQRLQAEYDEQENAA